MRAVDDEFVTDVDLGDANILVDAAGGLVDDGDLFMSDGG